MSCSIEGCDGVADTRGWCRMHYVRWHRHGDPLHPVRRTVRGTLAERMQARTKKTARGCWTWDGPVNRKGYGYLSRGKQREGNTLAHRLAWELTNGLIPDGLNVLHRCDNPPCVRPDHLFLGTLGDNNRDMSAKGRYYQQRVTHCPKGHEYTPENTKQGKHGRQCRLCHNLDSREYKRRKRAGAKARQPPDKGDGRHD